MNPSSLSTLAINIFVLEAGTRTDSCLATSALRIRGSISEIGSVKLISTPQEQSPARFPHSGNLTLKRQFPEANTAQPKLTNICPGTTAELATIVLLYSLFRSTLRFFNLRCLSHLLSSLSTKGHTH